jgi:biotin carboxylase
VSNEHYLHNPLIHRDRRLANHPSRWARQFDCSSVRPLIICRGPIRKEAIDVFREMGISHIGILLSEKDSIVYQNALAPELRVMPDPERIHRVPDYTGANKEERDQRIRQIIAIARDNDYNAVFAGYGFMAEDETMVAASRRRASTSSAPARVPCTTRAQGRGQAHGPEVRRVRDTGHRQCDGAGAAQALSRPRGAACAHREHGLPLDGSSLDEELEAAADQVLAAGYEKGVDLYTVDELCATVTEAVERMNEQYPSNRVRLKAISGGGGKGQRILGIGEAARATEMVREILNEVKTTGVGDNKNVLIELNIETTRHQEIQVIGNGDWCITLGGRDCSLQMHEQKLLEVSVTVESLQQGTQEATAGGARDRGADPRAGYPDPGGDGGEAARFGAAVGLDSVSTFECIVDRDQHFFMEMNTRIQVEHRVTELCYALKFVNPGQRRGLLYGRVPGRGHGAAGGPRPALPKPERIPRFNDSVEARLNATNQALQPSAGGIIEYWSDAIEGEIRDDQGISLHNPDTDVFMKYTPGRRLRLQHRPAPDRRVRRVSTAIGTWRRRFARPRCAARTWRPTSNSTTAW